MSTITGVNDGGYKYVSKSIEEIQDEFDKRAKKTEEQNEKQIKDLRNRQESNLEAMREKSTENVKKAHQEATDTIERNREIQKAEIDRMKAESYDKYGRYNGEDAAMTKDMLNAVVADRETEKRRNQLSEQETTEAYHDKLERVQKEYANKLETSVETARDSAEESFKKIYQDGKLAEAEEKAHSTAKYNDLNRQRIEESNFNRRIQAKNTEDQQRAFDHRVENLTKATDTRVEKTQQNLAGRLEQTTEKLKLNREKEAGELRTQLKDMLQDARTPAKDKADAVKQAIREFDGEYRARERNIVKAYEDQIKEHRNNTAISEEKRLEKSSANIRDRESRLGDILKKSQVEANNRIHDITKSYDKENHLLEIRADKQKEDMSKAFNNQLAELNESKETALQAQTKQYQSTLEASHSDAQQKVLVLQEELKLAKNNNDSPDANVSPAAEAQARRILSKHYDKLLKAEQERHQTGLESLKSEMGERLVEAKSGAATKETLIRQQAEFDKQIERRKVLDFATDVDFTAREKLKEKDQVSSREQDKLRRAFGSMTENQKRQFDEIMVNYRNDAMAKAELQRQDLEFAGKAKQREFVAKQNDTIREYEKKLSDQKAELVQQMSDLRINADRLIRETEKKGKLDLEDQKRSYEQRIAQLEMQNKERMRQVEETNAQQLDKLKRSYAELNHNTKKS